MGRRRRRRCGSGVLVIAWCGVEEEAGGELEGGLCSSLEGGEIVVPMMELDVQQRRRSK